MEDALDNKPGEDHRRDKQREALVRNFRLKLVFLELDELEEHVEVCQAFLEAVEGAE